MVEHRHVTFWRATHDNGWETCAIENPDGTFSAWAAEPTTTVTAEYREDTPEHAQAAALFSLKAKTGHARCSPACSGWEASLIAVDD